MPHKFHPLAADFHGSEVPLSGLDWLDRAIVNRNIDHTLYYIREVLHFNMRYFCFSYENSLKGWVGGSQKVSHNWV